jgi:hypothetical protein
MNQTPLRKFLTDRSMTAQDFATQHGLSVFNVRYWTRGDKEPSLAAQLDLERATAGAVTPGDWLAWKIAQAAGKAA